MKWMGCDYEGLLMLPSDYVTAVIPEMIREEAAAIEAARK